MLNITDRKTNCGTISKCLDKGEKNMKLKVGQTAPDFTLPSHLDKKITLSDLRGNNVVLAFFPLAWTPV